MNDSTGSEQPSPLAQQAAGNPRATPNLSPTLTDATGILKLESLPATGPAFTMLGSDDSAACIDGVCAVPGPQN